MSNYRKLYDEKIIKSLLLLLSFLVFVAFSDSIFFTFDTWIGASISNIPPLSFWLSSYR